MAERLWLREVRRASRRTNSFLSGQVLWGLAAAVIGAVVAALSPLLAQWWTQDVSAVIGAAAGPILLGGVLFCFFFLTYRFGGFHDADWMARSDDSAPGFLLLKLESRTGFDLSLVVEIWVKCNGKWTHVPYEDLPPLRGQNRWIEHEFSAGHQLYPGDTYEVRWYGCDRGKFVDITREEFKLRDHAAEALTGSAPPPKSVAETGEPAEGQAQPRKAPHRSGAGRREIRDR